MNRKIVQRSPDLGIGIKMKRLVPVVEKSAAPSTDVLIAVSSASAFSILEPFVPHVVTVSQAYDTEKIYNWNIIDITAQFGVDYTNPTNADVSDGVTCEGGLLTVPAGVSSFTLNIPVLGNPTGAIVTYQIRIGIQVAGVEGLSCGDGAIWDV